MTRRVATVFLPASLPVVGDAHPLRRGYPGVLRRGLVSAALFHLTVCTIWFAAASLRSADGTSPPVVIIDIVRPPSLENPPQIPVAPAAPAPPIEIGDLVPVDDLRATTDTYPTNVEISHFYDDLTGPIASNPGDQIIGRIPPAAPPQSSEPMSFEAVEVPPALVSLPAPAYPDMARLAEVEGTVILRVLVGVNGRVEDVVVTQSVPMLDDAAVAAARRAVFTPARQQGRPVRVWVEVPIRFRLS